MPKFSQIVGHEETIAHLKTAIWNNRVSHAYIFQGAPGSGKHTLADAFAAALQCETLNASLSDREVSGREASGSEESCALCDSCGECRSCHQIQRHNHPDLIYVTHEKENTISIDDIREQVIGDIQVKPYNNRRKVYIIPDAQLMNTYAQNALLKTLEEPPEYAVILLLTTNAGVFLDTIRSRCIVLDLKPVRDDQVMHYLMEHVQIPDYQAKLCAAFAQGSIGRAMALANSEDFQDLRELALRTVRKAGELDAGRINEITEELAQQKKNIYDFLDILAVWYRDVLFFKATRSPDSLIFRDQLQFISLSASKASYEGLETTLSALEVAKRRLEANAGFELTMQLLLLTMRDCMK